VSTGIEGQAIEIAEDKHFSKEETEMDKITRKPVGGAGMASTATEQSACTREEYLCETS
jgi:hypothetical protein